MKKTAYPIDGELDLLAPNKMLATFVLEDIIVLVVLGQRGPQAFQEGPPSEQQPRDVVALTCIPAKRLGSDIVTFAYIMCFFSKLFYEGLLDGCDDGFAVHVELITYPHNLLFPLAFVGCQRKAHQHPYK